MLALIVGGAAAVYVFAAVLMWLAIRRNTSL